MTSTGFAAVTAMLLLCSISVSCSCVEKFGNVDVGLLRERRRAIDEENSINSTVGEVRANIDNLLDVSEQKGFFKSFDLTKNARRLLPSSEDLKDICRKYLGSYESSTELPPAETDAPLPNYPETPPETESGSSGENETIGEDHVENDDSGEDDQGGKFYGPYYSGYYQGYYQNYPTGNNYGGYYGYPNGYYPNSGNYYGGSHPGRPSPGYPYPNYNYPGYGMPPGRPGYPGYGMNQGYGAYPGGYPGYNSPQGGGQRPGYGRPPPYMPPRPNGGYGRPPPYGSRPSHPMGPGYGGPPGVGGGYPNRPIGNRPPQQIPYAGQGYRPPNGPPPQFPYQESDPLFGQPLQGEEPSTTHPPGYLGNSCSVHENDAVPNTYGSMYGHSLYPNPPNYPPYYPNIYGPPPGSRSLRPLPTLAYTFCQYLVGKEEENQEQQE